ncbi:TetR/AcrR family transcriptional regulator [Cohnella nanjingensis]|uniref:TetR/AcrR family transcriptional regulator n=1 Tax=Cohnella nanjingensis TaxID=1387779 RepID=A0A7X0RXK4_9BACL|nr:TetR/AcrR family transcriptional regulator [Cohnella nanjingensis]MBB6675513.1 TetR/AcrR family transcriptional regulator [Cohnella nanjingensis]
MPTRQKLRSEETKQAILSAAGKRFAERGYEAVTMREIAKEAGCSHTTIYIYFKDKEELLHALSMPSLSALKDQFDAFLLQSDGSPESKLKDMSMAFIRFCLQNKTMHALFFLTKSTSVETPEPGLAINELRIALFGQIRRQLQACLRIEAQDRRLLAYGRMYFYMLHGIVSTYTHAEEPVQALVEELGATFEEAFAVLLAGMRAQMTNGG